MSENLMEESRRREYLQAMGVTVWERREVHGEIADETPVEPADEPDPDESPERKGFSDQPMESPAPDTTTHDPLAGIGDDEAGFSMAAYEEWAAASGSELEPQPEVDSIATLDWDALRSRVKACHLCGLRSGCTQTVFGVGNPSADLMVIGEAPGADEDRQGEPFVGRAGQLLNAMLQAIGYKREEVFIANILKCRPPNNRDPKPEEAALCEPYLQRQIELVAPKSILSVGRISAQNLLNTDIAVGKLRGRVHEFGEKRVPLIVTYHPAYLLRSPEQKAKSWDDLQLALTLIRRAES